MSQPDEHTERFREAAQRMSKEKVEERQSRPILPQSQSAGISYVFLISALRVIAWVTLVAGIIGCIVLWSNAPDETRVSKALRVQYLMGAISSAIEGFIFFVLFNVIAIMAETLEAIREKISREK